jgi:drug/metabolite transporter (DMT)-like permease
MSRADLGRLVLLAAIWGGSFPFMRVAAPALGPAWTAELRVLLGGLVLLAWLRLAGVEVGLRRNWRAYFIVGGLGVAAPFALYAFAAMHAPGSLLAVVNATAPIFGLVWGAAFREERVTLPRAAGLALGLAGVVLIAQPGGGEYPRLGWAVAAALGACCCYGLVGVLIKRFARQVPPRAMAAGNQLAAAALLVPLLPLAPPLAAPSALVIANVLALALLASGIAFVLYFRLIADVGAARALTVTYLIPGFGVLWGVLFLGERVSAPMLVGGALVLLGTVFVLRK